MAPQTATAYAEDARAPEPPRPGRLDPPVLLAGLGPPLRHISGVLARYLKQLRDRAA
jgi:hypothetical protein